MERVLTLLKSGGAFFYFLAKTIAKKTIQMKSSESIFCKKWAFFRFLAEKIFSVAAREVARRWSARSACEAFRARVDGGDGGCACLI